MCGSLPDGPPHAEAPNVRVPPPAASIRLHSADQAADNRISAVLTRPQEQAGRPARSVLASCWLQEHPNKQSLAQ